MVGLPPVVAEAKKVLPLSNTTYKDCRMKVELFVYPEHPDMKLGPRFQELVEEWERVHSDFTGAIETVTFEPELEDGSPWLLHKSWKPPSKDKPSLLYTESRNIFRDRRWDIIDRAINLREMGYWNQEYRAQFEGQISGGGGSPGYMHLKMFRRVTRARMHHVVVRFESIPLSELRRYLGATAPEYARLEDGLAALEDLRKAGKLTPRAYYRLRNERLDRLEQLETAALQA